MTKLRTIGLLFGILLFIIGIVLIGNPLKINYPLQDKLDTIQAFADFINGDSKFLVSTNFNNTSIDPYEQQEISRRITKDLDDDMNKMQKDLDRRNHFP